MDCLIFNPDLSLETLGVGVISLSKSPVRGGNLIETSLLSSSEVESTILCAFKVSSSELKSEPISKRPLRRALSKESRASLFVVAGLRCRLANSCTFFCLRA